MEKYRLILHILNVMVKKEYSKSELKKAFIAGYFNMEEENINYAFIKWHKEFVRLKEQMKFPKALRD